MLQLQLYLSRLLKPIFLFTTIIFLYSFPAKGTTHSLELSDAEAFYWGTAVDTPLPYRSYTNRDYQEFEFEQGLSSYDNWISNENEIIEGSKDYQAEGTVTLDLVFHVLHSSDESEIQNQIDFQLESLNRDFGPPNLPEGEIFDPDGYLDLATDTGIRFRLAEDEELQRTGVAVIRDEAERWKDPEDMKRGSPPFRPSEYINIWIIRTDDRIGSYAQIPGGPESSAGIVIDERYFGEGSETYNEGKTLTHLIGNYLGLHDLWGLRRCLDDGVDDTPIHNTPNLGDPSPKRISMCEGLPRAMTMNFMDNSNDRNMYMFTRGQVQRMRYILSENGLRPNLAKTN